MLNTKKYLLIEDISSLVLPFSTCPVSFPSSSMKHAVNVKLDSFLKKLKLIVIRKLNTIPSAIREPSLCKVQIYSSRNKEENHSTSLNQLDIFNANFINECTVA